MVPNLFKTSVLASGLLLGCATIVQAQLPACNSPDPEYDMQVDFPALPATMLYKVDLTTNQLMIKATQLSGVGWLGVGFSPAGHMEDSHAVVGQPFGPGYAMEYALNGETPSTVVPSNAAGASAMSVSTTTGRTVLKFTYPLGVGPVPVYPNYPTHVLMASGGNNPVLAFHQSMGVQDVIFTQCARPASGRIGEKPKSKKDKKEKKHKKDKKKTTTTTVPTTASAAPEASSRK